MGVRVNANTFDGAISMTGFPSLFGAQTATGEVELSAPWAATNVLLLGSEPPRKLELPSGVGFNRTKSSQIPGIHWVVQDKAKLDKAAYAQIRVRSERSRRITLKNIPIPKDSPVKMPWQAPDVLAELRSQPVRAPPGPARRGRAASGAAASSHPEPPGDASPRPKDPSEATFSSEVRMVNLTAAVYDAERRPLTGLSAADFTVIENGAPQKVAVAEAGDTPINLAVLLDLSASTRRDRDQMKRIARGFLSLARPQGRVAAYALANNWFIAVSELTSDRRRALELVDALPQMSGGSPVYDSIALAYGQDLAARPDERNALIVITDGLDNQFSSTGMASKIGHEALVELAQRAGTLIYPVFLGAPPEQQRSRTNEARAYQRLEKIAAASGGAIFVADSSEDFERVYEQVAAELRAVYSVAYYPANQSFQGEYRPVEVRVDKPGASVRSRDGYFAR